MGASGKLGVETSATLLQLLQCALVLLHISSGIRGSPLFEASV